MADIVIPIMARFWIYLISDVVSILCSIFVLYHLLFDQQLRRSLHNHVVIAIIMVNLFSLIIDIPWILHFYLNGVVLIFTPFFCQTWTFVDGFTYATTAKLVAWATIERYILIFHDRWMLTKNKRILLHYLPIGLILSYCFTILLVTNYFLSCHRPLYNTQLFCGFYSCAYDSAAYSLFELLSSGVINAFHIATFSAALLIGIVRQKYRLHQQVNWSKQRKMTIQLMSITLLYYVFYLPNIICGVLYASGIPWSTVDNFVAYGQFFSYCINFLLPFICAGTLPQLKIRLKNVFIFWQWHRCGTVEHRVNDLPSFANRFSHQTTINLELVNM